MQFYLRMIFCGVLSLAPIAVYAQEDTAVFNVQISAPISTLSSTNSLPDAPQAQHEEIDLAQLPAQQPSLASAPAQSGNVQTGTPASSSSQTAAPQSDAEKSAHEKAEEQLKEQEHQRVAGVMATFNTTSNRDALPLSSGQKFQLFFRSEIDPWPFLLASVVSGIGQADDSYPEWGQGTQGYAKRFGAAYSDAFIGNFFGNAVLTSMLHEDPRYFQKGTGTKTSRFLWAASSTVWCKRDKGGWGPNYANVGGNLIGSAIARAYYPESERTVSDTITDGLTVSAEGVIGSEVIEFWPDIARHYKRKHAEKLARQAAQRDAQSTAHPAPQSVPAAKPGNPQQ
jgi:hypothetical protein